MLKKEFIKVLKNYKTTIPGVAIAVLTYCTAKGYIDSEQSVMIIGVLTALGLAGAKDHDKKEV